jgi:selenocysteine lyase/cysteine desulfurase
LRYDYREHLDASREALAELLNAPVDTIALAATATMAVNIILRNMTWSPDGKDEVVHFSSIYSGCRKTIEYLSDSTGLVSSRIVDVVYPLEDDEIVEAFRKAVEASRAEGKRPKLALFDVVSSMPGLLFPFKAMVQACRELGVLSLVDGAQGIGMVPIDLGALDPDFFLSNCHKWLNTPRGCAVLHVPRRNQHLMPSTLPTSNGYVAIRDRPAAQHQDGALPFSNFVENFTTFSPNDTSGWMCVKHAIDWRRDVLGGEARIMEYNTRLGREGGRKAAEILGTDMLENKAGTLTACSMVSVWLPVAYEGGGLKPRSFASSAVLPREDVPRVIEWASKVFIDDYRTFMQIGAHDGQFLVRLSAQVYLELEDFEWAGHTLKEVSRRIADGEYKK